MPRRCYQDIKNQEIKTPRQDKAESASFALLCLLAWMDLAWKDGLEAMLGLDRKIQFRIVTGTPQGVEKSNIFATIQYIHICATSIHIHEKENTFTFSYSKIIFQEKFFSLLVFIFKFSISEAPNQLHGKMTLECFLRKQHATVQQYQVFNAWMVPKSSYLLLDARS